MRRNDKFHFYYCPALPSVALAKLGPMVKVAGGNLIVIPTEVEESLSNFCLLIRDYTINK